MGQLTTIYNSQGLPALFLLSSLLLYVRSENGGLIDRMRFSVLGASQNTKI